MKTLIEFPITRNYVSDWTFWHAIREILQNAIDQTVVNPQCEMSMTEVEENGSFTLTIETTRGFLERRSLLLGHSTKRDDDRTIGQFGEGLKLALLVLCRMGHGVRVINGDKEVWVPSIKKSKQYDAEILCISIEKGLLSKVQDTGVKFIITGCSKTHVESVKRSYIPNAVNDALVDVGSPGKIYVGGLFVFRNARLCHSYNFSPGRLTLGRDRNVVSDFDLTWQTSSLWGRLSFSNANVLEDVYKMLKEDASDVQYISSFVSSDRIFALYEKEFGRSVPVSYEADRVTLVENAPSVYVPPTLRNVVMASSHYSERIASMSLVKVKSPHEILVDWMSRNASEIDEAARIEMHEIVALSKNWMVKK